MNASWAWAAWASVLLMMDAIAMGYLVVPGLWLAALVVLVLVLCLVGVALRRVMQAMPRGVQVFVLVVVLGALTAVSAVREAAAGHMLFGVLPTRQALSATWDSLAQAAAQVVPAVPPVSDVHVFAPMVVLAIGFLATIVVVAVLVWQLSGVMVVATLVPWAAVFAMRPDIHWGLPALAVIWYLAFAFWRSTRPGGGERAGYPAAGARFGFVSVIVMVIAVASSIVLGLVAPALPMWGSGLPVLRGVGGGGGGTTVMGDGVIGVSTDFNVNLRLQDGDSSPVLQISGNYTGPLQVDTLTQFDGTAWQRPSSSAPSFQVADGVVLWPTGDTAFASNYPTTAQTTISFVNWPERVVPLGVGPRVVQFNWGNLTYAGATDSLTSNSSLRYTAIDEAIGMIDRDTLRDDHAAPSLIDQTLATQSLEVPPTSHTADLTKLAASITDGITDDYDKLMAIQAYLTSSRFTYTMNVDHVSVSDDAVWDFLQRRTGYCVHFATAMVVLGRLAGIPMRAAVGFTVPSSGSGDITNQNAHMWPQAHFAGAGWVSFEPTPGAGGAVPSPTPSPSPTTTSSTTTPPPPPTVSSSAPSSASPSAPPGSSTGGTLPWRWILLGMLVAVIFVGAVWGLRRWRAWRTTAERAWAVIVRAAQARGLIDVAATPRAVMDAVGPCVGDDARARLVTLVDEIERSRYKPGEPTLASTPEEWYQTQTAVVRDLTRRHSA